MFHYEKKFLATHQILHTSIVPILFKNNLLITFFQRFKYISYNFYFKYLFKNIFSSLLIHFKNLFINIITARQFFNVFFMKIC